ncbi:hypothetical protein [Paenibacillus sp. GYB003]|uniref:hypothetical protein n=1 Tax=Paenibacillus sp. GYB003 TaxID=2994392 RepID=UPI002F964247
MSMIPTCNIMTPIINEMKELYLENDAEWIVMTSHGKDSSFQLTCVWLMLLNLPSEQRNKRVHIVTGNTLVETPMMVQYVNQNLKLIEAAATAQQLPLVVHTATPAIKERFFYQVLGKGNPPPTEMSRYRWCTEKMKIIPTARVVNAIVNEQNVSFGRDYDVVMLLGVRLDESISRAASIRKHQRSYESKMARHNSSPHIMVYHPIKFVRTNELWESLLKIRILPWGVRSSELYRMYKDSTGECPLTAEGNPAKSCGGGRMGCYVCLVAGKEDKMLQHLVESGDKSMELLLDWKKLLYDMRIDIRYREPLRKQEYRKYEQLLDYNEKMSMLENLDEGEYFLFQRAKEWKFQPGPISIEGRKLLLRKLLYIQEKSGYQLIDREELEAIVSCWTEEGYHVQEDEFCPLDWEYDGPVCVHPEGRLNVKKTTNPNPIFVVWREFLFGQDEIIAMLKKRSLETGTQYFYSMSYIDYPEHYHFKDNMVYNIVQFIVCKPGIHSQQLAEDLIDEWLDDSPKETFDWEYYAARFYQRVLNYALSADWESKQLETYNKALVNMGKNPVVVTASKESAYDQLELAL